MPTRRLAVAATLAAAALSACGGGEGEPAATKPQAAESTATVTTKIFLFKPDPLTVKAGTTVTFENLDGTTHTVTAGTRGKPDRKAFDGELSPSTGSFRHKFEKPGTYPYFCRLHSGDGMTGEIVVR
jgi:plastocyanin